MPVKNKKREQRTTLERLKIREMLNYALRAHVKDSTNKNFILEIVLIYYLKNLILIFCH